MTPKEMVHKFYEMEALESHFKPIVDQLIEKYEQDVDWEEMMLLEKERLSRKPQNSSEEGDEGDQSDPTHQPVLTGARSKRRPIVTTAPNMDKVRLATLCCSFQRRLLGSLSYSCQLKKI